MGALYERFGRSIYRQCDETVTHLINALKNGDSQMRAEILLTLERMVRGQSSTSHSVHREISKAARHHLCDRAMSVRSASALVSSLRLSPCDLEDLFSV
jgi:predicted AAA+ superfamily ATPase